MFLRQSRIYHTARPEPATVTWGHEGDKTSMPVITLAKRLRRQALPILYRGERYECPACGSALRSFMAGGAKLPLFKEKKIIGAGYRQNNLCPSCWTTDRERLILAFMLARSVHVPAAGIILNIAPEPSLCRYFADQADVFHLRADLMRGNMSVIFDLQRMPLPDQSIDMVICNHVLEHVEDDRIAMAEILRVLKPGAAALLQAPIAAHEAETIEDPSVSDPAEREQRFGQDDHVRLYGQDYASRIRNAGFDLDCVKWTEQPELFGGAPERYGLNPEEILFLGKKPREAV